MAHSSPFQPIVPSEAMHRLVSHLSCAKRRVDTNLDLNQACASEFCNSMEAALNCIIFKSAVAEPLKLVCGFASRKMTAEQSGTRGAQCKLTSLFTLAEHKLYNYQEDMKVSIKISLQDQSSRVKCISFSITSFHFQNISFY